MHLTLFQAVKTSNLNPLLLPTDAHNVKKRRVFFNVMCISW